MFSHIIELTANTGQTSALVKVIRDRAVPDVIRYSAGWVDEVVLVSATEPNRVLAISFWRSKEDGDSFLQTGFEKVTALTAPFLSAKPSRQEFIVAASTNDNIVSEKR